MNYILSADWHIRATAPRIRKDEYAMIEFKKIDWILKLATKHKADIIVAGDIFDAPRCPYWLLIMYIELFKQFKHRIYVVPGQHDLHFHNPDLANTPLGALISADVVEIPNNQEIRGVGWEEEMPKENCEILIIHTPVTPDKPPFFMEDAISAKDMMEELHEYHNLIVTGDYHVSHCHISEDCILCNPGPIMRASKDKINFQPRVYLYTNGSIEMKEIPIEKDVFDNEALLEDDRKEYSQELKELISSFDSKQDYVQFWDVLQDVIKISGVTKDVQNILNIVKEKVNGYS